MKKALFIDRDGTLVVEPPVDYQLDSFEKLEFCPKVFRNLSFIRSKLDYELSWLPIKTDWERILSRKILSGRCIIWC